MVGRPSKYKPEFCELVIKCGEEGDTLASMAEACDVDRATINDWIEQHEEFSRAVSRGLQKAQAWWERQGRKATFGGTEGFNATSFIFNMKNRFKDDWRDKVDHGHENPDGTPISFVTVYERRPGDAD